MKLPYFSTTVTLFSKIISAILFITLLFVGFFLGMKYQKSFADNKCIHEIDKLNKPTLSTPSLINQALEKGEISHEQRLLYLTYAVYEYKSLPLNFQSNIEWEGTFTVEELKKNVFSEELCKLDKYIQSEMRRLLGGGEKCNN
jgi:hypothetical protein